MMWWIYKKDQKSYENLMGSESKILRESGDKIYVVFSAEAMNTWTMMGYWYGGE